MTRGDRSARCAASPSRARPRWSETAPRAWFTTFSAESSTWFDHVCIDVGLTCVRPEGRSMIVLAATDSD